MVVKIVIGSVIYFIIGFIGAFIYLQIEIDKDGEDASTDKFWGILLIWPLGILSFSIWKLLDVIAEIPERIVKFYTRVKK